MFRERSYEADRVGRVPDESIAELVDIGAMRMLVPARFGGAEGPFDAFLDLVRAVSSSCGSTGWVTGWFGVYAWHLGLFPLAAQQDVWGTGGPDALLTASYAAGRETVTETADAYRLHGRWGWAVGCEHAEWALLGGVIGSNDGAPADIATFLVPMRELAVERNWDTVGLRAAGCHDLVADAVDVPRHRMLSWGDCLAGQAPGQQANPGPLHRIPLPSVFASVVAITVLGIAEGAYASQVGWIRTRLDRAWSGLTMATDEFTAVRLAVAGSDIDAACLQVLRNVHELLHWAATDRPAPMALRRRVRRDQVLAVARAAAAVDKLFENSSGRVVRLGNPIEQAWRAIHTVQAHALNDLDRTLAMYGAGELDVGGAAPMV